MTGASAGILLASENTSPSDWKVGNDNVQPQAYISVLEMMMNFLISLALVEGVVIKFWREMLHGSTVSYYALMLAVVYSTEFPSSQMRTMSMNHRFFFLH